MQQTVMQIHHVMGQLLYQMKGIHPVVISILHWVNLPFANNSLEKVTLNK